MSDAPAQALAERCADAMYAGDVASQGMGMELVSIAPGAATMRMRVRPDMLNGHAVCHGGMVFSLADSCFAFAVNSTNHITLGAGARIDFLAPARLGDELTATALLRHQGGRSSICDVTVTNQAGDTIAIFRGNSARIGGHLVEAASSPAATSTNGAQEA